MPGEQNGNDQDQRTGGYGGSTGGQNPPTDPGSQRDNASAAGRDNPGADAVDADEAMGNRSGGYGGGKRDDGTEDTGS
jgi:hypothetical protein